MQVQELLDEARAAIEAKRVYGEPIVKNGVTVIPAAAVRGGGGGGVGHDNEGDEGGGGGFGLTARPAGAWVIEGNQVEWKAASDVNRIIIGAELVAALALVRALRPRATRFGWRRKPHLPTFRVAPSLRPRALKLRARALPFA